MTPLEEAKEELMAAIMQFTYEYGRFSEREQQVFDAIELVCACAVGEVT